MKIFTSAQTKQIDRYTIANEPIASIDLMERAAMQCTNWLIAHSSVNHQFMIFCGPGNNGGDGLAIARQLSDKERIAEVFLLIENDRLSTDTHINLQRLIDSQKVKIHKITNIADFPPITNNHIVVDALFGSGLSRPLTGTTSNLVDYLNQQKATKISIDIPSGLESDIHTSEESTVFKADHTLTFEYPFLSFLLRENDAYTGQWHVLPIGLHPEIKKNTETPYYITDIDDIKLKPRERHSHKGTYGHALLLAGSKGMMGAAILASKACLRTGVGLLTSHIPQTGCNIMQISVPECIVSSDKNKNNISRLSAFDKYQAIAIGPGISTADVCHKVLFELLEQCSKPMVIDADALNILSMHKEWLAKLGPHCILTPHPGEFGRLTGQYATDYDRLQAQREFSAKYNLHVLLKGAYSSIASPNGDCWFNSTGNPGMATAGSGDVLTGIILSLLAQGYMPQQAAIYGTFIHGLAGNIASQSIGQEAIIASDIVANIGNAYLKIRETTFT